MAHTIIKNHLLQQINQMLDKSKDAFSFKSSTTKGTAREIFLSELMQQFFPPSISAMTGQVIDSHGNTSQQIDIIIYNKLVMPPFLFNVGNNSGICPIEAVLYTIEVKSNLSASEIKKSIKNMESVKNLKSLKFNPRRAIFAYRSDCKKVSELDRYLGYDNDKNNPSIDIICIPNKIYCYHDPYNKIWIKWDENENHLYGFVMSVISTLYKEQFSFNGPNWGNYLL